MAPSVDINSSSSSFSITAAPTPASPSADTSNSHDSMKGKTYGDYLFEEDIGHGTFSTVWKSINRKTKEVVAIKVVSRKQAENCPNYNVKKEVLIHQSLHHPNIVNLIEAKKDEENYYLVLELGLGGELFEKIEPDSGFPEEIAHFYFLQLLNVLKYLQGEGVAHRDIKPENLLLDQYGNLKVTDFGLATVFKQHGQTRHLETPCGTAMYMAPEILSGEGYEGDQADMWSAAVVLFVMTAGCHPWEEPTSRCGHYDCFVKSRCHSYAPWNRFSADLKHLLTWMLKHNPKDRPTIDQVLAHPWVNRPNPFMGSDGEVCDPKKLAEALEENHAPDIQMDPAILNEEMIPALTQLEISALFSQAANFKPLNCFSQPIPMAGSGKSESSPATAQMQHLQRLARFYTKHSFAEVMERLAIHLDSMLVQFKIAPNSNRLQFSTVDRRKGPLTGDITFHPITESVNLVIFNKAKGDSLEFKRFFKFLLGELRDLVVGV